MIFGATGIELDVRNHCHAAKFHGAVENFFQFGTAETPCLIIKENKDMRQAGSDDKDPHWSLGSEIIENAQSNHLTRLSLAVAPPGLKRRENGKMGDERGIEK